MPAVLFFQPSSPILDERQLNKMNRRILTYVLAVCVMGAGADLLFGEDASQPAAVVYMGRSASFTIPCEKGSLPGRVTREIVRQSF